MRDSEKRDWSGGHCSRWLGKVLVAKPWASDAVKDNVLQSSHGSFQNDYFKKCRFEIMMNKKRRFAYVVATNICNLKKNSKIDADFHRDEVIPDAQQVDNKIYRKSKISRSHAARRYQLLYGKLEYAARACHESYSYAQIFPHTETLHFDYWGPLENMAEQQIQNAHVFMVVVYDDAKDAEFRGVQLPTEYYKVFSYIKNKQHTSMAFYAVDDLSHIVRGRKRKPRPKLYQVPVASITEKSGILMPKNVIDTDNYQNPSWLNGLLKRPGLPIDCLSKVRF